MRQTKDVFIHNESRLIDSGRHDYEYDTSTPFILTPVGFQRQIQEEQYPDWFYEHLIQIIGQSDINSVAFHSCGPSPDLKTFSWLCLEQLKRCAETAGPPQEVFELSVQDDYPPYNHFPRATRWGGDARYSAEGLGRGDLYIAMNRRVGYSAKVLIEEYWWYADVPFYILTDQDNPIKGYKRKVLEEGCLFLYKKIQ
ncbi:MAG: hypothetical protein ABJA60_02680 [Nitrosospira sp.]